jgi:hypothetical protein
MTSGRLGSFGNPDTLGGRRRHRALTTAPLAGSRIVRGYHEAPTEIYSSALSCCRNLLGRRRGMARNSAVAVVHDPRSLYMRSTSRSRYEQQLSTAARSLRLAVAVLRVAELQSDADDLELLQHVVEHEVRQSVAGRPPSWSKSLCTAAGASFQTSLDTDSRWPARA